MVLKHLPKFPFLRDTMTRKNTNWQNQFQLKALDSSSIIDGTNKERVRGVEKKDGFVACNIYRSHDSESTDSVSNP